MKRTIIALFGVLGFLCLSTGGAQSEDLFSIASHTYGAARFTTNVFGRNLDSDTTQDSISETSDLGGPIRCFELGTGSASTTATALYISSDDENDASDNNGVIITVEALDSNWDPVTITAALGAASTSGTVFAQVGSVTLVRVNSIYVADTSGAAPVGNIYLHDDTSDGGTDGTPDDLVNDLIIGIVIGENRAHQACYTVPNNYNGFVTGFCSTHADTAANATGVTFRLRSSVEGAASQSQEILELPETSYQCTGHVPPVKFGEKTDIELTAVSQANDATVYGSFDLLLIDDKKSGL